MTRWMKWMDKEKNSYQQIIFMENKSSSIRISIDLYGWILPSTPKCDVTKIILAQQMNELIKKLCNAEKFNSILECTFSIQFGTLATFYTGVSFCFWYLCVFAIFLNFLFSLKKLFFVDMCSFYLLLLFWCCFPFSFHFSLATMLRLEWWVLGPL